IGDIGPVRREDIVGLAAEQQVEGPAEDLAEGAAERLVEMRRRPAAQREAAGRVFLWAARRLHDAVEAGEGGNDDPALVLFPVAVVPLAPRHSHSSLSCPRWRPPRPSCLRPGRFSWLTRSSSAARSRSRLPVRRYSPS